MTDDEFKKSSRSARGAMLPGGGWDGEHRRLARAFLDRDAESIGLLAALEVERAVVQHGVEHRNELCGQLALAEKERDALQARIDRILDDVKKAREYTGPGRAPVLVDMFSPEARAHIESILRGKGEK